MLNFDAKPIKCQHCGKERGVHKANTLHCPAGMKTRIGYTQWHKTQTFQATVASTSNSGHD
jgi:hypothetical protein